MQRAVIATCAAVLAVAAAFAVGVRLPDRVVTTGRLAPDRGVVTVRARVSGMVTRVHASVGDRLEAGAQLVTLDPNMSPDKLADSEHRLALQQEDKQRLERALKVVTQIVGAPEKAHSTLLSTLGVVGDTFNIINDLYTARLELDNASEFRRLNVTHLKTQVASEIALAQRNIELMRRNLEFSRKDTQRREETLTAKRNDFESLLKLGEKGLVSSTDVNREREGLLLAEQAVTDTRKQVDQVELDISNRSLHINELKMQAEAADEDATNKFNAAQLRYDLRLARLNEHRTRLEHDIDALTHSTSSLNAAVKLGEGGAGAVTLSTPSAGILVRLRAYNVGDAVAAGSEVAVIQPDGVEPVVLAKIPNQDMGRVHEGQQARVKIDAFPYRQYGTVPARVVRLFAQPDTSDFTAKLALERPDIDVHGRAVALLPGLGVHLEIFGDERSLFDVLVHP